MKGMIKMNIKICENLKQLRLEKGNTQADLANHLGISIQSVSKWECGAGYPDITLIPSIAAYYCVSIDYLFGTDNETKEKRITEITNQYNELCKGIKQSNGTINKDHKINERIELMRSAVNELPNCWFFLQLLASDLWWKSKSCDNQIKLILLEEAEILCDKILARCPEERWKHTANSILCMIYLDSGRYKMALQNAYQSPDIVDSVDYKLSLILNGEELKRQLLRNTREFSRLLYESVTRLVNDFGMDSLAKLDSEVIPRINYIIEHIKL